VTSNRLRIPIMMRLRLVTVKIDRLGVTAYDVALAAMFGAVVVAAAIEPPTAYLIPLAVSAWALLYWTLKRESAPRYRRQQ